MEAAASVYTSVDLFPTLPFSDRAGWGYLMLSNMLPAQGNGIFRMHAIADDAEGNSTGLGARTIVAINSMATAPFGAIDTPAQGQTISGSAYLNWGWALTPQPKMIPSNGSTIQVIVDGVALGQVNYGFFRPDVAALFPRLENTNGAVGYRVIDTTALVERVHTIAWVVFDNMGVGAGIGSRYFTVANSADAVPSAALESGPDARRQAAGMEALEADAPRVYRLHPLRTLTVRMPAPDDPACAASYAGYAQVNGELRDLPVGASIDPTGVFHWQPGPAFHGRYDLLLVRTDCRAQKTRVPIAVFIE